MANTQLIESKQNTTENLNSAEKVVVAENETNEPLDNEINDNVNNINDNYISMNGDINNNEEHIEPPEIQVNGEENVEETSEEISSNNNLIENNECIDNNKTEGNDDETIAKETEEEACILNEDESESVTQSVGAYDSNNNNSNDQEQTQVIEDTYDEDTVQNNDDADQLENAQDDIEDPKRNMTLALPPPPEDLPNFGCSAASVLPSPLSPCLPLPPPPIPPPPAEDCLTETPSSPIPPPIPTPPEEENLEEPSENVPSLPPPPTEEELSHADDPPASEIPPRPPLPVVDDLLIDDYYHQTNIPPPPPPPPPMALAPPPPPPPPPPPSSSKVDYNALGARPKNPMHVGAVDMHADLMTELLSFTKGGKKKNKKEETIDIVVNLPIKPKVAINTHPKQDKPVENIQGSVTIKPAPPKPNPAITDQEMVPYPKARTDSAINVANIEIEKRCNERKLSRKENDSDEDIYEAYRRTKPRPTAQGSISIVDRIRNDLRSVSKSPAPPERQKSMEKQVILNENNYSSGSNKHENIAESKVHASNLSTNQDSEKSADVPYKSAERSHTATVQNLAEYEREKTREPAITAVFQNKENPRNPSSVVEQHKESPRNLTAAAAESQESAATVTRPSSQNRFRNMKEIELIHVRQRIEREKSLIKEMSQVREVPAPLELMNQLVKMSSANVSDELRKSCSNILAKKEVFENRENCEKEILLKRLEKVLTDEKQQVSSDLIARRKQLAAAKELHFDQQKEIAAKHTKQLQNLKQKHEMDMDRIKSRYRLDIHGLKEEIAKLQNEIATVYSPNVLLQELVRNEGAAAASSILPNPAISQSEGDISTSSSRSEMDAEFQCCVCGALLKPPGHIYQCSEGDLLCTNCKTNPDITTCPDCGQRLEGDITRNKALEKLAQKYFNKI